MSIRPARCEEVIIYEETVGRGDHGGDPVRTLIVVRSKDGKFIAERDTWLQPVEERVEILGGHRRVTEWVKPIDEIVQTITERVMEAIHKEKRHGRVK